MTAIVLLVGQVLLVLSVFCARPAGAHAMRARLVAHATLLAAALLARLVAGGGALALVCLVATLLELGLIQVRFGRWLVPTAAPTAVSASRWALWPMAACVLLIWLSFRLMPLGALASVSLAIVLCGAVALLAARDEQLRWTSLLLSGHGVLLFVGAVPGPGWPGLLLALPLQAVALFVVCRRPVWSDVPEPAAP